MAKCQQCGKGPQYGNNRPWSNKTSRRRWYVNVQKVNVIDGTKVVSKRLCASCIRTLSKA